jgi:transcriptional antiterminator NusG
MSFAAIQPNAPSCAAVDYPWFALRVKSNFEKVVATSLRSRGYAEYLPIYKCRKRLVDRVTEKEMALFPGYLFCRLNIHDRLPVLMTPGVVHIVGAGKEYLPVAEEEVRTVQRVAEAGRVAGPWPFLKAGQRVLIERGPLAGVEGILVDSRGGYRLVVSIALLQRSVAAEVDLDWVRPLGPTQRQNAVITLQ